MSFDFIPVEIYTSLYHYFLLIVILLTFFDLHNSGYKVSKTGYFTVLFIIIYMGFRPISHYFVDMVTYSKSFLDYQSGATLSTEKDVLFEYFTLLCSKLMNVNFFFFLCALVYIYPLYLVCKKWFPNYWFYAFLLIVSSFSFWAFGTNGIRNGLATSVFLYGVSKEKRLLQFGLILLAIGIHKSMILPGLGFLVAQFYNKPKVMIAFWMFCIPLSLLAGGFWETFFASLGFEDDRISYLTEGNINDDEFSSSGFRWDFLLYSATAVNLFE
jgi:hypothetical protein